MCCCSPTKPAAAISKSGKNPHLHLLHDLLAEGADFGGAGDGHVLGALVLAGHTVEGRWVVLHVVVQVRLKAQSIILNTQDDSGALCWAPAKLQPG